MLNILGSQTSPFVRMTRAVCEELSAPYELTDTGSFANMSEENRRLISASNPLMKVPVLIDGGARVIDSRVIIAYLRGKHENPAAPVFQSGYDSAVEEENILTVIYGITDAAILRFIMGMENADMNTGYMARSYVRMQSGPKYLDEQADLGKTFGICELALVCALDWFKKRDIVDWSGYENVTRAHDRWQNRPSLVKTRIP